MKWKRYVLIVAAFMLGMYAALLTTGHIGPRQPASPAKQPDASQHHGTEVTPADFKSQEMGGERGLGDTAHSESNEETGRGQSAPDAPIQGYAEQLSSGVDHFMAKLKPGKIFGRCNWFVAPTPALRWIDTEPQSVTFAGVTAENAGERLCVRSERQTLRRLPQTGAIVFTIGVYVEPLAALSPDNLARLVEAVATIPPTIQH